MFEYLKQIDEKVFDRYLTVEKNIKSASNSFYDSFLNLQEAFVKIIIEKNGIDVDGHATCGELLKDRRVEDLFLKSFGVDTYVYKKMGDYTKKANEHKHKKEKHIEVDTIVRYMSIFHSVSNGCMADKSTVPAFDEKYFKDIFGSASRVDERLGVLEEGQQQILQAISKLGGVQEKRADAAQRGADGKAVLKNFIAKAEKKYNWFGTEEDFKKSKKTLIIIQSVLIFAGLLSTVLTSVCLGLYSTFTLFENIVLIQTVILLTYALRTKKYYPDHQLAKYTADVYVQDSDGIWRDGYREKKKYKWMRRISYIAVLGNIICIWTMGSGMARIFATVFELAFLALTIASSLLRINLYCMYNTLFISGYNASGTEKVTIVYDCMQKKLLTFEEYKERYSPFI